MARKGYSAEFRRRVLDLIESGRKVRDLAIDLEISEQTIYTWRKQARIDAGLEAGLSTSERGELASARRRIRELETELKVHRRATELLKETSDPKGGTRRSE
jgi:transposase